MRSALRPRLALPLVVVALVAGALTAQGRAGRSHLVEATNVRVVVPRGQPVEIAFVGASDFPTFTQDFRHAIQMAIEDHPTIRGFSVQINEFDPPCSSGPGSDAENVAAADKVVANAQNTAVIGHVCSTGFRPALPIYESADVVTLSGSATAADLPSNGPTVFNRTAVPDPGFDTWYAVVRTLPSDLEFDEDFTAEFGSAPSDFSDLYSMRPLSSCVVFGKPPDSMAGAWSSTVRLSLRPSETRGISAASRVASRSTRRATAPTTRWRSRIAPRASGSLRGGRHVGGLPRLDPSALALRMTRL